MAMVLRAIALATVLGLAAPSAKALDLFSGRPVEAIVMSSGTAAAKVARLRHVESLGVIRLIYYYRPRLDTDPWTDARNSASRNAGAVAKLRAALAHNPATRAALAAGGVNIGHIVGAEVSSDGALRVYVL
jgi:hypothetical protein